MQPEDGVRVALSLLNLTPTSTSTLCMFERDFFGSFVMALLTPVVLMALLLLSYGLVYAVLRVRRSTPPDRDRLLWRPMTSFLFSGLCVFLLPFGCVLISPGFAF
jgi:hypothetical protein